jgi:hypothetical protein
MEEKNPIQHHQTPVEEYKKYFPKLVLRKQTGMIFAYRHEELSFQGRPKALSLELLKITIWNLIFGWWSRVSLLINPFLILLNISLYIRYCFEFDDFKRNPKEFMLKAKRKEIKSHNLQRKYDKFIKVFLIILIVILIGLQIPLVLSLRR